MQIKSYDLKVLISFKVHSPVLRLVHTDASVLNPHMFRHIWTSSFLTLDLTVLLVMDCYWWVPETRLKSLIPTFPKWEITVENRHMEILTVKHQFHQRSAQKMDCEWLRKTHRGSPRSSSSLFWHIFVWAHKFQLSWSAPPLGRVRISL